MRYAMLVGMLACVMPSAAAAQETITDQKAQADLESVRAATAKTLIETQKAKVDLDKAVAEPLKGLTGNSATVNAGDKTVEAMLLGKMVTAGASAKVVAAMAALPVPQTAMPYVVIGTTPPSVSQWRLFEHQREEVRAKLQAAVDGWNHTHSNKMAFGAVGVATLVATIVPLLMTDSTMTGASMSVDDNELSAAIYKALDAAQYPADDEALRPMDGKADAGALLRPLDDLHSAASDLYRNSFIRFYQGSKKPEDKIGGANLKAALADYDALESSLLTEANGVMSAVVVRRQRDFEQANPARPILYITNRSLSFTTTTKKGLSTAFTRVPAYGSAGMTIDYAVFDAGVAHRGSVSCVVARRKMTEALDIRVEALPAMGAGLCSAPASQAGDGTAR